MIWKFYTNIKTFCKYRFQNVSDWSFSVVSAAIALFVAFATLFLMLSVMFLLTKILVSSKQVLSHLKLGSFV